MKETFGPFHRKRSPTQTYDIAKRQAMTGTIWGRPIKNGGKFPCVKAYQMPLCAGSAIGTACVDCEGIEFTTSVVPAQIWPTGMVLWREAEHDLDGLYVIDEETIAIVADVYKVHYLSSDGR